MVDQERQAEWPSCWFGLGSMVIIVSSNGAPVEEGGIPRVLKATRVLLKAIITQLRLVNYLILVGRA
jgi:hypothetical protein